MYFFLFGLLKVEWVFLSNQMGCFLQPCNGILVVGGSQIILKEDVAELGKKGQLMDVKAGYYRNYLHPMGMAQIVTPLLLK